MPFLLFLLSVATLVAVSSKSKAGQSSGRTQTFMLDANMPDPLRNQVLAALVSGTDPATLDAFGTAIQAQYPLSAGLLHAKATSLRAGLPSTPTSPSLPASSDPGGPPLDPGMPPPMVAFVHTELATEMDPMKLLTLANTIAAQYPIASGLLTQRAAVLNVQPSQPSTPSTPPTPQPSPGPGPATPSGPALNMPGLDPGMPPDIAQAVMEALINENDPAKLQAFAQRIRGQYPLAASLLATKANTLLALQQPQPSPLPQPMPGPLPAPIVPPDGPVLTATPYTVQDGDYPWKIAAKVTGHGARWPELVAANPNKPRAKDGNFATLLPGEKLSLPAAWTNPAAQPSSPTTAVISHDPSAPAVIAPQPSPPPTIAPSPTISPADAIPLDANIPADVAAAVRNALKTATDPNQVRGFASAIAPRYPKAAELLTEKATALSAFGPTSAVVLAHGAVPAPSSTTPTTYKVKAGDSPSKIAAALVHDGNRWHELVAANPQKKRAANGNFANLIPGEVLQLPPSWAHGTPARATSTPGGA